MYHIHAVWHKMGMDVKYLKECIGRCLAEGLAEAADRRPVDPIDFLAHFIYNYRNRLNEEEKRRIERAELEREHEEALAEAKRIEKLKAEELLVAKKFEKQQQKRTEQKDARIPEEHETTAESKKETLEDKMEQGYISAVKAELGETPGEQNTSTTLQEALTEITMDEDFNRIPQETMDDRGESQLEHDGVNQNEHDTQTEDDTEDEEDTPDEESKSSQDLNLE
ncbi:DPY30 domain-containing protein 1-like isoform X3 [Zootoca vivipara]|uniref:DPY30 domain-containing protein 1-like isoform X3 n=1 Tax=Zootoca vivipara TaxID=8524 RepID=UPI00293BC7B6|nr:DPY30 domain-containing protein 1-like isoform X3 [Zootoca vivipara]